MENIAEILKGCPTGTKLYCTIWGDCEVDYIDTNREKIGVAFPSLRSSGMTFKSLDAYGRYDAFPCGECVLFPSKSQRDWKLFKNLVVERYKVGDFKPFDKVLVRDYEYDDWTIDFFERIEADGKSPRGWSYSTMCSQFLQCIPYNEETEYLVGKAVACPEYYKSWEN